MKLAVNHASPAALAERGHDLAGLRERPVSEFTDFLAELGLSDTATQTAERLLAQLASAESSLTEQKAVKWDMLLGSPIFGRSIN